jgi:hypothetical protein
LILPPCMRLLDLFQIHELFYGKIRMNPINSLHRKERLIFLHKFVFVTLFISSLLAGCGTAANQNGTIDMAPLSKYINEEKIEKRTHSRMNLESMQTKDKSKVRMAVVDQLIDEYILLLEAKKREFSVSDEEIDKLIEFNIETAAKVQNEEFKTYLDSLGMSIEDYYRDYAYVKLKEKLLENKLNDDITKDEESPELKVKKWNAFKEELISEFRKKNDEQIKKLIDKVERM